MGRISSVRQEGYLLESYRLFHLRDTAGQERDYHFHAFDKLVILLSGRVTYEVENISYPLRQWDVLLVKHHTIHKANIDVRSPYERIILYFDRDDMERLAPEENLMECFDLADRRGRHRLVPDEAERERLARILEELENAAGDDRFGAKTLERAALLQMLVLLGRMEREGEGRPEPLRADYDGKIGRTLTYINENLAEDLSVDSLAARVYLSRAHFMRLFREQTGSPVHVYVRQRRLLHAARLIRSGVPAGRAAAESGYSDYSAFFRAFRDCFGASPNEIK